MFPCECYISGASKVNCRKLWSCFLAFEHTYIMLILEDYFSEHYLVNGRCGFNCLTIPISAHKFFFCMVSLVLWWTGICFLGNLFQYNPMLHSKQGYLHCPDITNMIIRFSICGWHCFLYLFCCYKPWNQCMSCVNFPYKNSMFKIFGKLRSVSFFETETCCALFYHPFWFWLKYVSYLVILPRCHMRCFKMRLCLPGQPRRHLLTTGWSSFVNKKKLVSGDAVLFLR
jgi:hypothetical protein